MGLLLVALPRRERHPSSSVSGSESESSVFLVGRRHHPEVPHLLERPQGALWNHLRVGCPSGTGIAFRHCPLAGMMGVSLRHPLLRWIPRRRGLVLLSPCPCPLSLVLLPQIYRYLPVPLPILRAFDEGSSAFMVNATSKGPVVPWLGLPLPSGLMDRCSCGYVPYDT